MGNMALQAVAQTFSPPEQDKDTTNSRQTVVNILVNRGILEHIAQKIENYVFHVTKGLNPDYQEVLSHTVLLLENKTKEKDETSPFSSPVITVPQTSQKEIAYLWGVEVRSNSVTHFLVGGNVLVKLTEQENANIEYQYRSGNNVFFLWLNAFKKTVKIDLLQFTIDNQTKIVRQLHSFGNRVELPQYWDVKQTHIFTSYQLSQESQIYQKIASDLKRIGDVNIREIKVLQHLKNYIHFYFNKLGDVIFLYLGTFMITRTLVVDNFEIAAKQMQVSKQSTAPVGAIDRLSEDIRVAHEDAYNCKICPPRKQILCCLCSPGRVMEGEMNKFPNDQCDAIKYPLQLKDASETTAYVMNIRQVVPAFFIEYA